MNVLGDLEAAESSIVDESTEVLSRAESLKEYLQKGKNEQKAGKSNVK